MNVHMSDGLTIWQWSLSQRHGVIIAFKAKLSVEPKECFNHLPLDGKGSNVDL